MNLKKSENLKLNKARKAKDDEYYTCRNEIQQEICYYKDQLKGKVILMPCDDPELIKVFPDDALPEEKASQFWVYFHQQFTYLGLKKIIATHYSGDKNDSYLIEYGGGQMMQIF